MCSKIRRVQADGRSQSVSRKPVDELAADPKGVGQVARILDCKRESKLETVAGNPCAMTHTQSGVFEIHEDLLSLVYAGADHHVSFPTSWMRSSSFFRKQTMPGSSTHPAALPAVLHFARQP